MRRSSVRVWKTLAASSRWTFVLVACPQADGKIRSKGLKIVCKDVNEAYFPRYHNIDYFLLHDLNWFDPTWMCWIPRDNYDIPIPFDTIRVKLYLFQSNHIIAHLLIYSLQIFIVILFKKHEFARSCFIQSVWKAKLRELQQANTELADLEEDSFKRRVGCVAIVFLERSSCVLLPASTHLHLLDWGDLWFWKAWIWCHIPNIINFNTVVVFGSSFSSWILSLRDGVVETQLSSTKSVVSCTLILGVWVSPSDKLCCMM